jgi:Zincin-like metallopeptidase
VLRPRAASASRNRSASSPPSSASSRPTTLRDNPPAISGTDRSCESRRITRQDRSQVEPLPDFPGGAVELEPPIAPIEGDGLAVLFEPLRGLASSLGVAVVTANVPAGAGGVFRPASKEIGLLPVSSEVSPNQQVKTLIHELAHALVRLDRQDEDPQLAYAEEEVVVECVAYTVCSGVGFDVSGFSVPYVASWSAGAEIERHAALIDRLARRLEEVALPDSDSGRPDQVPGSTHQPGPLEDAEVVGKERERLVA